MAREQRIGARLERPNIARLYDAGVDEKDRPYIAMEYVDGRSIDAWCAAGGLDARARLALYAQVVRAVAYAHGQLTIHCDLKPANVLVDARGQVHLLDFGISRLLETDAPQPGRLTLEYGRALTPTYAAPEQVAGRPVGVAADVYSLGVMLFELLTGALPYRGPEDAIRDDAPAPSSLARDPGVRRALKRPSRRR